VVIFRLVRNPHCAHMVLHSALLLSAILKCSTIFSWLWEEALKTLLSLSQVTSLLWTNIRKLFRQKKVLLNYFLVSPIPPNDKDYVEEKFPVSSQTSWTKSCSKKHLQFEVEFKTQAECFFEAKTFKWKWKNFGNFNGNAQIRYLCKKKTFSSCHRFLICSSVANKHSNVDWD